MTVKHVQGDLFALDVDAIGHGVNCKGVMGAGIAVAFKKNFPQMFPEYANLCRLNLLSLGQVHVYDKPFNDYPVIYNIASQDEPGPNADYYALAVAMRWVKFDAERRELKSVALPQIGCGIGGLQWTDVRALFSSILALSPVEFQLVTYEAPVS